MHDEEFRRAIEAIKLRAPIEDVVRERVPGLRKSGNGWVACCPFHEERTPSFRVDPRRGTWHCFGACSSGGDQIGFLQRMDNLPFWDALEILAARTGVELPRRASPGGASDASKDALDALRAALERAVEFYQAQIATPEGAQAATYLSARGLSEATAASFGVGYAPASGRALVAALPELGVELAAAVSAGLVRHTDDGRPYDFFRGRLVIPIRDERGRAVGFGARRLRDGDESGPKYVNTAETALFRKGRLVYALDRAMPAVRREGRIVLVEGYTDVMAAHQHGFTCVVAVLGTATTEDHAALIRRSGARRATLVFDGDEAGSKASAKALHGLLPLDLEIDVVALEGGIDPCDLLVRDGAAPFRAQLDLARGWLEHTVEGLRELRGIALSREVDRVLDLVARVKTPVHRESLLGDLAARLRVSIESLREQYRARTSDPRGFAREGDARGFAEVRAGRERSGHESAERTSEIPSGVKLGPGSDPRERAAWRGLVGALLADPSLVPLARGQVSACAHADLGGILRALLELYSQEDAVVDATSVLNRLGEDPARDQVVPLLEEARTADSPRAQLEDNLRCLKNLEHARWKAEQHALLQAAERAAFAEGGAEAAAIDPAAIEKSRVVQERLTLSPLPRTD